MVRLGFMQVQEVCVYEMKDSQNDICRHGHSLSCLHLFSRSELKCSCKAQYSQTSYHDTTKQNKRSIQLVFCLLNQTTVIQYVTLSVSFWSCFDLQVAYQPTWIVSRMRPIILWRRSLMTHTRIGTRWLQVRHQKIRDEKEEVMRPNRFGVRSERGQRGQRAGLREGVRQRRAFTTRTRKERVRVVHRRNSRIR